ncbi:MAG: hypothetical protein KC713_02515, partial [Candidatus Omnitrophica bacterium]|nr:hypothetical protein [Candidatus Omnitrophota bacterium]
MQKKILGIIAGNGKFPILFAHKAKQKGYRVIVGAVKGDTSFLMRFVADQIEWFHVGDLKKLFDFFKRHQVKEVIMAGQVNPKNLFDANVRMDEEFQDLFQAIENRKADTIFNAVAQKLQKHEMRLVSSIFLIEDHLALKGTLTRRGPSLSELDDITFGQQIAKLMGKVDVGQ